MKKGYILSSLALASVAFFAFQKAGETSVIEKFNGKHHLFSGGGMSGVTGAPGESNCTQCHSGTAQSGASQNILQVVDANFQPVTTYIPGTSYTVTVSLASNPAKRGFSATALDGTNTMAGSFTGSGIGGTQDYASGGRDYVSHTASSNTDATSIYAWTWQAPATNVGPVTFYVASNEANNNGATSGDVIYISSHVINPESGAGIEEVSIDNNFTAGYNASSNKLDIKFDYSTAGDMHVNVVDMNGRSVFTYDLGQSQIGENHETIALPSSVKDGMYVVHFFVDNKAMSANILVKK